MGGLLTAQTATISYGITTGGSINVTGGTPSTFGPLIAASGREVHNPFSVRVAGGPPVILIEFSDSGKLSFKQVNIGMNLSPSK